jgi:hypothetical protein
MGVAPRADTSSWLYLEAVAHLQASHLAELEQRRADAPGRPVDEDALARLYAGGFVQHQVGREIVGHQADGLGRVQASRDGYQLAGGQANRLGVTSSPGIAGKHLPHLEG